MFIVVVCISNLISSSLSLSLSQYLWTIPVLSKTVVPCLTNWRQCTFSAWSSWVKNSDWKGLSSPLKRMFIWVHTHMLHIYIYTDRVHFSLLSIIFLQHLLKNFFTFHSHNPISQSPLSFFCVSDWVWFHAAPPEDAGTTCSGLKCLEMKVQIWISSWVWGGCSGNWWLWWSLTTVWSLVCILLDILNFEVDRTNARYIVYVQYIELEQVGVFACTWFWTESFSSVIVQESSTWATPRLAACATRDPADCVRRLRTFTNAWRSDTSMVLHVLGGGTHGGTHLWQSCWQMQTN